MSFWTQLRSGGGTDADIRALQASQERLEAESSLEDTDELTMGRVDYDEMALSMNPADQTAKLDGDKTDTDTLGLQGDALDGPTIAPPVFRLAGGDATTYQVNDLPAGKPAKTGDKMDGIFTQGQPWCFGFCQVNKL